MGSDPNKDKDADECEQPQHRLYLPDYWFAKTPVTNIQYAMFVQATGYKIPRHWRNSKTPSGRSMHPVVYVSWDDAMAYCQWLTEVTGKFYTLPSEAEWEKASRGTDGRLYPWGDIFDGSKCNVKQSGIEDTTPVDWYPQGASPYGVLDMAGNVWEWTRSQYKSYPYDPADGREDVLVSAGRVLRGGVFCYSQWAARCASRPHLNPTFSYWSPGFRVVEEVVSEEMDGRPQTATYEPVVARVTPSVISIAERAITGKQLVVGSPSPRQPFEPEMILIPAGEFLMGSDPHKDKDALDREQPQHTLYLPDYYIAKTPVTNAQYAAFVQATGYKMPKHWENGEIPAGKDAHPVVNVSWDDAMVYYKWLAEATGKSYTLPSEAEWEKAARGTDGRLYPWGNTFDQGKCNVGKSGIRGTAPVDKYPQGASPYGVLDMAGNVYEWTRSLWGFAYPLVGGWWLERAEALTLKGQSPSGWIVAPSGASLFWPGA
jgi:formylglycine-generating enzyme required for sulfatase activity